MANPFRLANQYRTYDGFESRHGIRMDGTCYRLVARELLKRLGPPQTEGPIYDIGCGTGNSTLEIALSHPRTQIIGVEKVAEMLDYARIKFGKEDSRECIRQLFSGGQERLALFLLNFMREATGVGERVTLVHSDFFEFDGEPAVRIVGSHVLHWLDTLQPAETPRKFARLLRTGGDLALASAVNFYKPKIISGEVNGLCYPFVLYYLENLRQKIEQATGRSSPDVKERKKKDPDETIALFASEGLELIAYDELKTPPLSPEILLDWYLKVLPDHLGLFEGVEITDDVKARMINEALYETLMEHIDLMPPDGMHNDSQVFFFFRKKR